MSKWSQKQTTERAGIRRTVMLSSEIDSLNPSSDAFVTSGTVGFKEIADHLEADYEVDLQYDSVPDVLRQAHVFNARIMNERDPQYIGQWLGLVSALLLAPKGKLEMRTLPLSTVDGSLFMRAVSKNLLGRKPMGTFQTVTLFLYKGSRMNEPWVPVAFAFNHPQGFRPVDVIYPVLIFSAAEIGSPLDCDLPWYRSVTKEDLISDAPTVAGRMRTHYYFDDPLPALSQPAYIAQSAALYTAFYNLCVHYPGLADVLMPYLDELPHNRNISRPMRLNSDVFPGVDVAPGRNEDLVRLNSFLTDYLCLIQRESEDVLSLNSENAYFLQIKRMEGAQGTCFSDGIMPLSTTFVEYLNRLEPATRQATIESLQGGMELTENSHGGIITYTLTWTFEGVTITKLYDQGQYTQEDLLSTKYFPVLAVWPRVKFEEARQNELFRWKHYYVYWKERQVTDQIRIRVYPEDANSQLRIMRKEGHVEHTADFPEILTVEENGRAAGLLILKPDNRGMQNTGATRIIGVDFGTSNTTSYWCDPAMSNMPSPLSLYSYLLPVTAGDHEREYSVSFISSRDFIDDMFTSMLRVEGTSGFLNETRALTGSTIPFTTARDIDSAFMNELYFDLKWRDLLDTAAKSRTTAFLSQLIQMYALEAKMKGCSYLFWRFSWPRAMTNEEFDSFKESVTTIVDEYSALPHTITFFSEADAVGDYITTRSSASQITRYGWQPVLQNYGFACIDIGGGSVDISVWQDNELCAEASLREVAADTVLCESVVHKKDKLPPRKELLEEVFDKAELTDQGRELGAELIDLMGLDKARFEKKWALSIESIAQAFRLRFQDAQHLPHLRSYLSMIETYLSAVVYYTAVLTRQAVLEGRMRGSFDNRFSVFFSGNGAQMIRFLHGGEAAEFRGKMAYQRLCAMFARGLQVDDFPQLIIPLEPKHEVAFGMACRPLSEKECDAQQNWNDNRTQSNVNFDFLRQLYKGQATNIKEDRNLSWAIAPDFAQQKKTLKQLFRDFWDAMWDIHKTDFMGLTSHCFAISAKTPEEALECAKQDTDNILDMLDDQKNERDRRDMNTMFAFALRQLVTNARG